MLSDNTMTIQKDTTEAHFAIKLGGSFPIQKTRKQLYPYERLTKFLNLDPNDEKAIIEYCNQYVFIPGYPPIEAFRQEHKKLIEIARRLDSHTATERDLEVIDNVINTIRTVTKFATSQELNEMNHIQGYSTIVPKKFEGQRYLIQYRQDSGTIASLWHDMVNQIIENQNIKTCIRCGKFFWITRAVKKHDYCSEECRNAASHKDSYAKKKKLKKYSLNS